MRWNLVIGMVTVLAVTIAFVAFVLWLDAKWPKGTHRNLDYDEEGYDGR